METFKDTQIDMTGCTDKEAAAVKAVYEFTKNATDPKDIIAISEAFEHVYGERYTSYIENEMKKHRIPNT